MTYKLEDKKNENDITKKLADVLALQPPRFVLLVTSWVVICALMRHCCVSGTRIDFYHCQVIHKLTKVPITNNSKSDK